MNDVNTNNDEEQHTLLENKHITIKKKGSQYSFHSFFENNNLRIPNLINLQFMDVLLSINTELIEYYKIKYHSETESTVFILFKHLYKDLGMKQRYLHLDNTMVRTEHSVQFISTNSVSDIPYIIEKNMETVAIDNMVLDFNIIHPHYVPFICDLSPHNKEDIDELIEKMALAIFSKIFIRVKLFIDNYQ